MTTITTNRPKKNLPYGRQCITAEDIAAVTEVLQSDWLTQGPTIAAFEEALAQKVGAKHVVACSNGTAALHLSMLALGLGPGDRVLTTPITFLADANCARYVGAEVAFADIDGRTGLVTHEAIEERLKADHNHSIKAVIPVDFAGQPGDLAEIAALAHRHGAMVVEDACHALGATYSADGRRVMVGSGAHADMTVFSFHPVKHVAMGEGGAIATNDAGLAERLRMLRSHGMQKHGWAQPEMALAPDGSANPWYYEMQELGYNYRVTDIQAALGLSQLKRLGRSVARRREIAAGYRSRLAERFEAAVVRPLDVAEGVGHAWHLFVVLIDFDAVGIPRAQVMNTLRESGIGTQVHYIPIHLQPYYRNLYGFRPGDFPGAERYYRQTLSLPMYPELSNDDVAYVVDRLAGIIQRGL